MSNIVHKRLSESTDPEILSTLGERLRRLRDSLDLTMEEAAARAGLSSKTVSRAEAGRNPTVLTLLRLLRVYGRIEALEQFIPEAEISPMAIVRARASGASDG